MSRMNLVAVGEYFWGSVERRLGHGRLSESEAAAARSLRHGREHFRRAGPLAAPLSSPPPPADTGLGVASCCPRYSRRMLSLGLVLDAGCGGEAAWKRPASSFSAFPEHRRRPSPLGRVPLSSRGAWPALLRPPQIAPWALASAPGNRHAPAPLLLPPPATPEHARGQPCSAAPALAAPEATVDEATMAQYQKEMEDAAAMPLPDEDDADL